MAEKDILSRLLSARLPCNCLVKASEHQLHEEDCLYRLVREGVAEIERLRAELRAAQPASVKMVPRDAGQHSWVRLMCFFGTDGVWNSDDRTVDIATLPFSKKLADDLVAWRDRVPATVEEAEKYSATSLSLARRIKSEAPHWKVVYVDRSRAGADIRTKDVIEIEITV